MVVRLFTLWLVTFFAYFSLIVDSYLDLEELTSIQYGIDISDKPLLLEEDDILLSSKYGQLYRCSYRSSLEDARNNIRRRRETEETTEQSNITQLLQPMESAACLIHTAHWWTYEFCYKKDIRQYHLEEGKIAGDIIVLGYYVSEFDWNKPEVKASLEMRQRFHSQHYENGSKCDITGDLRETYVRFMCEENILSDYIQRVEEPSTCSYIITVRTTRLCASRMLAGPEPKSPVSISCHPALDAPQLESYTLSQAQKELTVGASGDSLDETWRLVKMFIMDSDLDVVEHTITVGEDSATDTKTQDGDAADEKISVTESSEDKQDVKVSSEGDDKMKETVEGDEEVVHELKMGGVSVRVHVRHPVLKTAVTESVESSASAEPEDADEDSEAVTNTERTTEVQENADESAVQEDDVGTEEAADTVETESEPMTTLLDDDSTDKAPPDRIEVKVINAAYYDSNGKPVSKYPQDSSTTLDQMVLAILKRNVEEKAEYQKQHRLEENYRFTWKGDTAGQTSIDDEDDAEKEEED